MDAFVDADWHTVRETVQELRGQGEVLAGLLAEHQSLLRRQDTCGEHVATAWKELQETVRGAQASLMVLVPFLEWHSQPPQCDSQPPQPLALRAPAPRASIAHSPNSWDLGYHLSVNVADAPCPCQQLAAKGYTVLSFAVGERDASAFLRGDAVIASAVDWFHTQHGQRRTERGRHAVGGGRLYKTTPWSTDTVTSMWIKPYAVLRVSAAPLTLRLEKASGASPADPESYTIVRAHRGMSEVWRARGQCWRVRLEAPFRGEGFDALKELMQGTPKLSWAKRTSITT